MTRNQIEYAKLLESKRANAANEALTLARDQAAKDLGFKQLSELRRHQVATEAISLDSNAENKRKNAADEAIRRMQLEETQRSNVARESLEGGKLAETRRSNQASEQLTSDRNVETARSNAAMEAIAIGQAATQAARLVEDVRQHLAREAETKRHNVAMELKPNPSTSVSVSTPVNVSQNQSDANSNWEMWNATRNSPATPLNLYPQPSVEGANTKPKSSERGNARGNQDARDFGGGMTRGGGSGRR